MQFPPGHATTPDGLLVARFKLLCAADGGGGDAALAAAGQLLSSSALVDLLRSRPLAALDVCLPVLSAHWTRRSWHAADETGADRVLPLAATLAADAAVVLSRQRVAAAPATLALVHTTAISRYLLTTNTLAKAVAERGVLYQSVIERERSILDGAIDAARGLSSMFGGALHWLRDDVPFVEMEDARTRPSLQHLAQLCAAMPAAQRDDAELRRALGESKSRK